MEVFNIFKNSCKRTDAASASVQKINYINYISVVAIYCCHQPSVGSKQRRFHLLICDLAPCPTSRERLCIIGNRNAFNRIDRVGCLDRSNSAVLYLIHNNRSFHTSYFLNSVYSKHYEAKKLRPDKAASHIPRWQSEAPPAPDTPAPRTAPAPKKDTPAKKQKIITTSKESILSKPKKEE